MLASVLLADDQQVEVMKEKANTTDNGQENRKRQGSTIMVRNKLLEKLQKSWPGTEQKRDLCTRVGSFLYQEKDKNLDDRAYPCKRSAIYFTHMHPYPTGKDLGI